MPSRIAASTTVTKHEYNKDASDVEQKENKQQVPPTLTARSVNEQASAITTAPPPMPKELSPKKENSVKTSLFASESDDDGGDIFVNNRAVKTVSQDVSTGPRQSEVSKPPTVAKSAEPSPATLTKRPQSDVVKSLFADDSDEDDDIFTSIKKAPTPQNKPPPAATNASTTRSKQHVPMPKPAEAQKAKPLFADSDSDDLFG